MSILSMYLLFSWGSEWDIKQNVYYLLFVSFLFVLDFILKELEVISVTKSSE